MNFNSKISWIAFTIILFSISFLNINDIISFDGDELGTLDLQKIHKPIPYKIIVSLILGLFNKVPENILLIRFSSLLFSLVAILIWYKYLLKSRKEIIIFNLLFLTNSFILRESSYFRYYSFYFLTSSFFLAYAVEISKEFNSNVKLLISIIITFFSPFVFFVINLIQYLFFLFNIIVYEIVEKTRLRTLFIISLILSLITLIIYPNIAWYVLDLLNLSDIATNLNSNQVRGFSIRSIIKPLFAIFQFFYGYDTKPTESIIYVISIIIIFSVLLYFIYKAYHFERILFRLYLFCFILPFLILYLILEPISMPGFTQLESKHGLFIYPLILFIMVRSFKYISSIYFNMFLFLVIISQLTGMYNTFNRSQTDWFYVKSRIEDFMDQNKDARVLLDGRSSQPIKFYLGNNLGKNHKTYTWESKDDLYKFFENIEKFALVLNDYKSYTPLNLQQNWNSGSSSFSRVEKLDYIVSQINYKFKLLDSYVSYPTFIYFFEKKRVPSNIMSFSVWEHNLKDIQLPFEVEGFRIISSILINQNDSIIIKKDNKMIINIEGGFENIKKGTTLGIIKCGAENISLNYRENIWDLFSDFNNIEYDKSKVFHTWDHKPLVSSSIKYIGSYYKHKASIFEIELPYTLNEIVVVKNLSEEVKIRVWQ